jgi:DNA-binding NarL/FixJ family response regulator
MSNKKYRITIIEPSEIVSSGLKHLIEYAGIFQVVKIFRNLQEYAEPQNGKPDIIIVNPSIVIANGFDSPKSIAAKENTAFVAINYGAYDDEILRSYDGNIGIFNTSEQIEKKLQGALKISSDKEQEDGSNELSTRECEILTAVAKGKTNKEIADEFNLSIHTVISHRKNISHKLGINSIAGLTIYAVMNKLLDVEDF